MANTRSLAPDNKKKRINKIDLVKLLVTFAAAWRVGLLSLVKVPGCRTILKRFPQHSGGFACGWVCHPSMNFPLMLYCLLGS